MDNTTATAIKPSILGHLGGLEKAVGELANSWRPNDPTYRAELYRQIMMHISFGYFVYGAADAEHPDWAPLYNPVFACQPNPDDIYLFSPLRSDLSYKVSGDRGTSEWTLTGTTTDGERIEVRGCDLWTFRDGKVTRKDSFWKIVERQDNA